MRAMQMTRYGGPDALALAEVDVVHGREAAQQRARSRQGAEPEAVEVVIGVGLEARVVPHGLAQVDDRVVVGDARQLGDVARHERPGPSAAARGATATATPTTGR